MIDTYTNILCFIVVLIRIRGENYEIKGEIEEMQNEKSLESKSRSMWSVLRDKSMLLPILLVAALQGGQQLSGINAVFYYSVSTFVAAGLTTDQAKYANLGFGLINTFVALFSPYLMANCNRRPLIQFSAFLSGVFLTIICIIIYYIVSNIEFILKSENIANNFLCYYSNT